MNSLSGKTLEASKGKNTSTKSIPITWDEIQK